MNRLKYILLLATAIISSTACGIINGSGTNSEGSEAITFDASLTNFDASSPEETFKSIPYKNTSGESLTLYKVFFENNLCNSFSYYGLNDPNGNMVMGPADAINYSVKSGERVQAVIRFKSEACTYTNYTATVYLYFRDSQNRTFSSATVLQVKGEPPAGDPNASITCGEPLDTTDLLEDRRFGIPGEGDHYLRVDRMRAFIFPTDPGAADYLTIIGTDIGDVDPTAFISPYLKITISEKTNTNAKFILHQITTCDDFSIPSALSDTFFLGSPTLLTSTADFEGKIAVKTAGGFKQVNLSMDAFRVTLLAENIGDATPQNDDSIIDDKTTKSFRVGMQTSLTTETTAADEYLVTNLPEAKNYYAEDEKGQEVLNMTTPTNGKRGQQGSPLSDSRLMLVGKGQFDNENEDFIGDTTTAKTFLIDKTALIYVQINATLMCSTSEAGCE